jgi:hypothetical protein
MAWADSGWLWAGGRLVARLAQNSGSPWRPAAPGWAVSNTNDNESNTQRDNYNIRQITLEF